MYNTQETIHHTIHETRVAVNINTRCTRRWSYEHLC